MAIDIRQDLLDEFITRALAEDVGDGDHTSLACIDAASRDEAYLLVKDVGTICGIPVAKRVMELVDPTHRMEVLIEEGSDVHEGERVFTIEGNTQALLKAERLILNTMQRLSAIATLSSRFMAEVEDLDVKLLDTRKTTPLMRFLEKYAVAVGGCDNYRHGLYDWIMIKDNHVEACGGIGHAIDRVKAYQETKGLSLGVTVEVRNLDEMQTALAHGGFTRMMFDNFDPTLLREGVDTVAGRYETEASGGIRLETVRTYALTGVDYISIGALTHSAEALDLSLKIRD